MEPIATVGMAATAGKRDLSSLEGIRRKRTEEETGEIREATETKETDPTALLSLDTPPLKPPTLPQSVTATEPHSLATELPLKLTGPPLTMENETFISTIFI